jgi:hypothetical protein
MPPRLPPTFLRTTVYTNEVLGNVIVEGNIRSGFITANVIYGNVSGVNIVAQNVYGNLTSNNWTPGNVTNLNITGNMTAGYFIGNGIIAVEGNIGNTGFLGGNVAVSGQVNVVGNVTGDYFIGNLIGDSWTGNNLLLQTSVWNSNITMKNNYIPGNTIETQTTTQYSAPPLKYVTLPLFELTANAVSNTGVVRSNLAVVYGNQVFQENSRFSPTYGSLSLPATANTYVQIPSLTSLAWTAQPFTMETWVYLTSTTSRAYCIGVYYGNAAVHSMSIGIEAGGLPLLRYYSSTNFGIQLYGNTVMTAGTWHHLAMCSEAVVGNVGNVYLYCNGVRQTLTGNGTQGTYATLTNPMILNYPFLLGGIPSATAAPPAISIQGARVLLGNMAYTAPTFTPGLLTNGPSTANTALLLNVPNVGNVPYVNSAANIASTGNITLTMPEQSQYNMVPYTLTTLQVGVPFTISADWYYTGGTGASMAIQVFFDSPSNMSLDMMRDTSQLFGYRIGFDVYLKYFGMLYSFSDGHGFMDKYTGVISTDNWYTVTWSFDGSSIWAYSVVDTITGTVWYSNTISDLLAVSRAAAAIYKTQVRFAGGTGGAFSTQYIRNVAVKTGTFTPPPTSSLVVDTVLGTSIIGGLKVKGTIQGAWAGVVDVRTYGAVGDGITDDTVAINNALRTGQSVAMGAGNFLVSGTLYFLSGGTGQRLIGCGIGATTITATSGTLGTTYDLINITNASRPGVCQMLLSMSNMTGGFALTISGGGITQGALDTLMILDAWDGIQLTGTNMVQIQNVIVQAYRGTYGLKATSGLVLAMFFVIFSCAVGVGQYGMYFDDFNTVEMHTVQALSADIGLYINNSHYYLLTDIELDVLKSAGVLCFSVDRFFMTNSYIHCGPPVGTLDPTLPYNIYFDENTYSSSVTCSTISGSSVLTKGIDIMMSGNQIQAIGENYIRTLQSGIIVQAPAARVSIVNNSITYYGAYAVEIQPGAQYVTVSGCTLSYNRLGGIYDATDTVQTSANTGTNGSNQRATLGGGDLIEVQTANATVTLYATGANSASNINATDAIVLTEPLSTQTQTVSFKTWTWPDSQPVTMAFEYKWSGTVLDGGTWLEFLVRNNDTTSSVDDTNFQSTRLSLSANGVTFACKDTSNVLQTMYQSSYVPTSDAWTAFQLKYDGLTSWEYSATDVASNIELANVTIPDVYTPSIVAACRQTLDALGNVNVDDFRFVYFGAKSINTQLLRKVRVTLGSALPVIQVANGAMSVNGVMSVNGTMVVGNLNCTGDAAVGRQINAIGNVVAPFFIGNGSQLTGIAQYVLPGSAAIDITGNVVGDYANITTLMGTTGNVGNVRMAGGNIALSGQVNVLGNVVSTNIIGSGTMIATTGNIGNVRMDTGVVTAPRHTIDGNYYLTLSGSNPIVNLDAFDYLGYNRTSNSLFLVVGGNTKATIDGVGNLILTGNVNANDGNFSGNVRAITGNVGNTRFLGGNVAVSGQINALGNVVAPFFVGNGSQLTGIAAALPGVISEDIIGNVIGAYANVTTLIGATGNVGNVRMVGGNVAVSGQVNVLGNVVAPSHVVDGTYNLGVSGGDPYINFDTDDHLSYYRAENTLIYSTKNVARLTVDETGNLATTGNLFVRDGIFTGNVVVTKDIRGANTMTLTCAANANILTVSGTSVDTGGSSLIQGTTLRGNNSSYSLLRLDNTGGRLLDINGNGEMSLTSATTADIMTISTRTGSLVGNALAITVPKLSFTDYSFINCRNLNGTLFSVDGRGMLTAQCAVNGNVVNVVSTSSTNTNDMIRIQSSASAAQPFNMISAKNAAGNVFRVSGNGAVFGVGAYNTSGADYAEMFEWEDGNTNDEDRRGVTVVKGNNGVIRMATGVDNPATIFGVVSTNPSIVGDAKWDEWNGRYLRDRFGTKLSNVVYYIANVSNENERVRCASVDKPPEGYEKIVSSEFIENPEYDPNVAYVARESRKEWATIGLVGKLMVLPGQVVNPNWILFRTISHPDGDVLEYIVK